MPKVHFVKKALKDNPVAKKGESYYWWKPKVGGRGGAKRYSKDRPKPSQLTQSEFLSAVYSLQEEMAEAQADTADDLIGLRDGWVESIREIGQECQDKFDNMPDGLQQGDTGQTLEERAQAMEQWADDLEAVDLDDAPEPTDKETEGDESALAKWVEEKLDELKNVSCDF